MFCESLPQLESSTPGSSLASVRIGDVSLGITSCSPERLALDPYLMKFASDSGPAEIQVAVDWCDRLNPRPGPLTFDSGAAWKLFRDGNEFVFDFASSALGSVPYKRMTASADFGEVSITLNQELLHGQSTVYPLEYPADELIFTNYCASHGFGVEVHGCGLVDSEVSAYLFLGHSGAGKSTTARLWHSLRTVEILSDDRIILRLRNKELWMYGTPWHGDGQFASPAKARVERIFILQHGTENKFVALPKPRAVGELFARCFPPFHNPEGLERTLEFLNLVAAVVPCYIFEFTPDSCALEAVCGFVGRL